MRRIVSSISSSRSRPHVRVTAYCIGIRGRGGTVHPSRVTQRRRVTARRILGNSVSSNNTNSVAPPALVFVGFVSLARSIEAFHHDALFVPSLRMRNPAEPHLCVALSSHRNLEEHATELAGALGLPSHLHQLKCGEILSAFRRVENGKDVFFEVERIAARPPIFLLRGVLRKEECEAIISAADTMETAETVSGETTSKRRNCQVAWLSKDAANGLVGSLAETVGRLVLTPSAAKGAGAGYEDMQVVHYSESGEYVLHHDGNERVVTVLYYLTSVGETWFPLAYLQR